MRRVFFVFFCFKAWFLQDLAKKKVKADKAGSSRPSAQIGTEDPEAVAKAPEGSGAKAPGEPESPAPPPPQV